MAVKIKLMRMGKMRAPYYRIVVADARTKRDGRAIEEIGKYHPTQDPSYIEVNGERAQYWLGVGAQPTEPVLAILKITGDWQRFRGEPGAEGTLRVAAAKPDKRAVFEAAARETMGEPKAGATTPRRRASASVPGPSVSDAPVAEPSVPEPSALEPLALEPSAPDTPAQGEPAAPAPADEATAANTSAS